MRWQIEIDGRLWKEESGMYLSLLQILPLNATFSCCEEECSSDEVLKSELSSEIILKGGVGDFRHAWDAVLDDLDHQLHEHNVEHLVAANSNGRENSTEVDSDSGCFAVDIDGLSL